VSIRAYLLTAVRNRAFNVLAHRRVRSDHRATVEANHAAANNDIGASDALDAAEDESLRQRLLGRAFAALTEKQRTAVRLRYSEGLAMAEVATALGISVSATERLVARALRAMREQAARQVGARG
jgi:RNA polymerase sigma factor (sigma-70 family)